MENLKNKKNIIVVVCALVFVILSIILFFIFRPNIKFKDDFKVIEYGTEYTYEDMIESVNPKDAKIIYPDFSATEVGNYKLTFNFKKGDKEYKDTFSFRVEDTSKPKVTLYFKDENIKVRLNDKNVDVLANIHYIENLSEGAFNNKVRLEKDEFITLIKKAKELNKEINEREITSKEDIKEYDVQKNGIYYTTDLDVTNIGTYSMRACVIDENYNIVDLQWEFEVVESDQLLNSGGRVSCTYKGEDLVDTEAYSTSSIENYKYTPFKLVSYYEIITTMSFSDDYDTEDNIYLMMDELRNKYGVYNEIKGVTVSINHNDNVVTTSIAIDFNKYDKKKDELGVLVDKSNAEIDMQSILNNAEANKYICTIK